MIIYCGFEISVLVFIDCSVAAISTSVSIEKSMRLKSDNKSQGIHVVILQ